MERSIQLSVFVENKPGTLARICEELSANDINIFALTIADTIDHAIIRMVVNEPRKALELFEERGTFVSENEVLMLEGKNQPGELARIAVALKEAQVNIEYAYLATPPGETRGLLVLRASELDAASKALESIGY
jgi:hypothetical protein